MESCPHCGSEDIALDMPEGPACASCGVLVDEYLPEDFDEKYGDDEDGDDE